MSLQNEAKSPSVLKALKGLMMALLALIIGVVSVSFASHHMRLGFEREYVLGLENKIRGLSEASAYIIDGGDIVTDPLTAGVKYEKVLSSVILNTGTVAECIKTYGVFSYNNGELFLLTSNSPSSLKAGTIPVSTWFTAQGTPHERSENGSFTVLTPIRASDGSVVGLYELSASYTFLDSFGNTMEQNILFTALISLIVGLLLFSLHYLFPVVFSFIRLGGKRRGV